MTLHVPATILDGQIAAGRLVLRAARISDTGLFAMYAGDERVARGTQSIPHPLPPGAAEAFVARVLVYILVLLHIQRN